MSKKDMLATKISVLIRAFRRAAEISFLTDVAPAVLTAVSLGMVGWQAGKQAAHGHSRLLDRRRHGPYAVGRSFFADRNRNHPCLRSHSSGVRFHLGFARSIIFATTA
jgi:hypothetical protein